MSEADNWGERLVEEEKQRSTSRCIEDPQIPSLNNTDPAPTSPLRLLHHTSAPPPPVDANIHIHVLQAAKNTTMPLHWTSCIHVYVKVSQLMKDEACLWCTCLQMFKPKSTQITGLCSDQAQNCELCQVTGITLIISSSRLLLVCGSYHGSGELRTHIPIHGGPPPRLRPESTCMLVQIPEHSVRARVPSPWSPGLSEDAAAR